MSDLRLLLWLRVRHARTSFVRLMYVAGTDYVSDRGLSERAYQLYILAAIGIALALTWVYLLDEVGRVLTSIGPLAATDSSSILLLAPAVLFAASSIQGLRCSWLKLSRPDVAHVAQSPVRPVSLALSSLAASFAVGGVVAALAGFALASGLDAAIAGMPASALALTALATLATLAALAGGALAGTVRLASSPVARRRVTLACGAACLLMVALFTWAVVACASFPAQWDTPRMASACVIAGAIMIACLLGIALLSPRIDMVTASEEGMLYADEHPSGTFLAFDSTSLAERRRRSRLARRGAPFNLLMLDPLPFFVVATLASCVTLALMTPPGVPLPAAWGLAALVNAGVVLSGGLDAISLSHGRAHPWAEGGLAALVALSGLASLGFGCAGGIVGAAAACGALALIVWGGTERPHSL